MNFEYERGYHERKNAARERQRRIDAVAYACIWMAVLYFVGHAVLFWARTWL